MSKTLRWTPQQLENHLKRVHGDEKIQDHPSMRDVQKKTRMQTLLDAQSKLKQWETVDVSKISDDEPIKNKDIGFSSTQNKPDTLKVSDLSKKNLPDLFRSNIHEFFRPNMKALGFTGSSGDKVSDIPRRIGQRQRAIASLSTATWTGSYEADKHLEIVFHGVVLLSVNTLYGLTHYERIKYRKSWHELIERAVSSIVGNVGARQAFGRYIMRVHRVSRRLADTDAKSGYLKYPIDGLRYSGVLVEDTQTHFKDLLCSQALGLPALAMRIEAVEEDYVPVALQGQWAQGLLKTLAPPKKEEKKKKEKLPRKPISLEP